MTLPAAPRALLALLVGCTAATALAAPLTPQQVEAASDRAARTWLGDKRIAGFSIAVLQDGQPLFEKSYGLAHVELNTPMPQGAVYEIASEAKPFTAAAVLRLAAQGKLRLDAPLAEYLPDVLPDGIPAKVTLRQMLTHTSGIAEFTAIEGFDALSSRNVSAEEVVKLIATQPLAFEPGTQQAYSNSAYLILGMVIRKVSGQSWAHYVEQTFLSPLGLRGSRASRNLEIVPNLATPYELDGERLVRAPYHSNELIHGNAGIRSTAGDMARWVEALHGGRVLDAAMYRQMTRPAALSDGTPLRYGLGLVVADRLLGHRAYFHGGTFPGYMSYAVYLPERRLAVAVLTNTTGPFSEDAIARNVLKGLIGDATVAPRAVPVDFAPYVGEYVANVRTGRRMKVAVADGVLTSFVEPWDREPRRFIAQGNDRFTSEWFDLTFIRRDGKIVGVRLSSQVSSVRFERAP